MGPQPTRHLSHGDRQHPARRVVRALLPAFNAVARHIAGRPLVTWAALLDHRGRRSGRLYRTPVTVRRVAPDAVVIALTWGRQTDWCQNLFAAGRGSLRWLGATYSLEQPRLVGPADAEGAFSPLERLVLRRIGVRQFVWLRLTL